MKKISTFLTLALVALVAFVSCAEPKYSDKMVDVKPMDIVFDNDESDRNWTVKDGYGAKTEIIDNIATITAIDGNAYTQTAFKFKNPGSTKAVIEYTSTGKVTFGLLGPTADAWDPRLDGDASSGSPHDTQGEPAKKATEIEVLFPADKDVGFITVGSNGDATNVITITRITIQ